MWQELSFETWVELNTDNKSPRLMDEINNYIKEKNVPENASDLRHLRKAGRPKKNN